MFFAFKSVYSGSHPLLDNFRLHMRLEEQLDWQIEFPGDHQFLPAILGVDFRFLFHGALFLLVFFHDGFQFVEAVLPHLAEGFNVVGNFFHPFGIQAVVNFPAILLLIQQLTLAEDLQVFGNGGPGGVKLGRDGPGRHGLRRHQQQDRPPGRVGEGLKYVSS
jgi:hypothetical protein